MANNDTDDGLQRGRRKLIIHKHVLSRNEYNVMIEELLNDKNWPYRWEGTPKSNQEIPTGYSDDDTDFLNFLILLYL